MPRTLGKRVAPSLTHWLRHPAGHTRCQANREPSGLRCRLPSMWITGPPSQPFSGNAPSSQKAEWCPEGQSTTVINHPLGTEPCNRTGEAYTHSNRSPVLREFTIFVHIPASEECLEHSRPSETHSRPSKTHSRPSETHSRPSETPSLMNNC